MESHFLRDFVSGPSGQGGTREPWYNPDGDCIIYQTTDEAIVADRIDESLTIYRSVESGKAIGYQIKGVAAIVKRFGWDGIKVEWSEDSDHELRSVSTHALLLAAYDVGPRTIGRRRGYADALQSAANHPRVQLSDLATLGLGSSD